MICLLEPQELVTSLEGETGVR